MHRLPEEVESYGERIRREEILWASLALPYSDSLLQLPLSHLPLTAVLVRAIECFSTYFPLLLSPLPLLVSAAVSNTLCVSCLPDMPSSHPIPSSAGLAGSSAGHSLDCTGPLSPGQGHIEELQTHNLPPGCLATTVHVIWCVSSTLLASDAGL